MRSSSDAGNAIVPMEWVRVNARGEGPNALLAPLHLDLRPDAMSDRTYGARPGGQIPPTPPRDLRRPSNRNGNGDDLAPHERRPDDPRRSDARRPERGTTPIEASVPKVDWAADEPASACPALRVSGVGARRGGERLTDALGCSAGLVRHHVPLSRKSEFLSSLARPAARSSLPLRFHCAQTEWQDTARDDDGSSPKVGGAGPVGARKGDETDPLGLRRGGVLA